MAISSKEILRRIGSNKLDLIRVVGNAYWYFSYTSINDKDGSDIYETRSVYLARLNQWPVARWVAEGKDFIKEVESGERPIR